MITSSLQLDLARQEFLEFLVQQKKSRSTSLAYGKDLSQLIAFLKKRGTDSFDKVTSGDLKEYVNEMQTLKYTVKSIGRKINSIKTFYRFLVKEKGLKENASSSLEYPKYENLPPRILTPLEYRALRDAAKGDVRIYAIIELFLQTGVRISEIANLRLEDIKNDEIYIRPIEGRPERTVPLNKPAKAALDLYLKTGRGNAVSSHIFLTKTGRPLLIRNIRTSVDRYFKIAGIKNAKVNDLRHTWIAHHLQNGTSLLLVNKIAGHKRLSTTERYLELVKDKIEQKTKLEEL